MPASRPSLRGLRACSPVAACGLPRSSRRTCRTTPPSPSTAARSAARRRCRRARRACAPSIHMNPVLLKPETDTGAQVIVQGKRVGTLKASNYAAGRAQLLSSVLRKLRAPVARRRHRAGRRRRQSGGNQPAPRRHRQHGICRGRRRAGDPARRHRSRRRHRQRRRHACGAPARRARAHPRFCHQQVPRRPAPVRRRPCRHHADDRMAVARARALAAAGRVAARRGCRRPRSQEHDRRRRS